MQSAVVASGRILVGLLLAVASLSLYAGCGDQSSERHGGGGIPDLTAGGAPISGGGQTSESGAAGASEGGAAGEPPMSGPVPWCDAYKVINCVCQQCHQNPPVNGAPIPLMTYEDTQAPYPFATSTKKVWQEMQLVVGTGFMPYTADPMVMPPVKPLADEPKHTLLTWLMEGGRDEGGTDCPQTCDWSDGTPEP